MTASTNNIIERAPMRRKIPYPGAIEPGVGPSSSHAWDEQDSRHRSGSDARGHHNNHDSNINNHNNNNNNHHNESGEMRNRKPKISKHPLSEEEKEQLEKQMKDAVSRAYRIREVVIYSLLTVAIILTVTIVFFKDIDVNGWCSGCRYIDCIDILDWCTWEDSNIFC
jgi:hypothetical protein